MGTAQTCSLSVNHPSCCLPTGAGSTETPQPLPHAGGHIYLEIHIYMCTYTHKMVFFPHHSFIAAFEGPQELQGTPGCRQPEPRAGRAGSDVLPATVSLSLQPCPLLPPQPLSRGYQSILTADPSKQMARISLHPPKGFRRNSPYEEYLRFVFSPKSTKREFNGNAKRLAPSKDPPLAHGPCPVVMLGCSETQCPTRGTALAGTAEDGEPTRRMSGRVKCCSCQGKLVQLG